MKLSPPVSDASLSNCTTHYIPQVIHYFCPTWLQIRSPQDPSLSSINLLMAQRTYGNTLTTLLKDMIKNTDEHPDEEKYGVRPVRSCVLGWRRGARTENSMLSSRSHTRASPESSH